MKKYNRHSKEHSKLSEEAKHLSDYYFYALWYDDCYCGNHRCSGYYRDCDNCDNTLDEEGMDWYYENREIMERNKIINEVLDIIGDSDDLPFDALNF